MTKVQELFLEFSASLESISDRELISKFNRQIGNGGWGIARSAYLAALRSQLDKRKIDYSAIGNDKTLSYKHHVFLVDKKLFLLDSLPNKNLLDIICVLLDRVNVKMKGVRIIEVSKNELRIEMKVFPFKARLTSKELAGMGSNIND